MPVPVPNLDPTVIAWAAIASLVLAVAGAVVTPVVLVRIPADYLLRERTRRERFSAWHGLTWVVRHVVGLTLLVAGIAMLVLPGQGLLTILVAIAMMDIPRKRAMLRGLLRRTGLGKMANRLRAKADKPPLLLGPEDL